MSYEYLQSEPGLWTVGSYSSGKWDAESDHDTPEKAAARVRYLNGGTIATPAGVTAQMGQEQLAYAMHQEEYDNINYTLEEFRAGDDYEFFMRMAGVATPAGVTAQVGQEWPRTKFLTASRVALVSLAHAAEKHGIYKSDYERFAAAVNEFASATTPAAGQDDARDAARYRWLRDKAEYVDGIPAPMPIMTNKTGDPTNYITGYELDAAIDAAMSAAPASEPVTAQCETCGGEGFVRNMRSVRMFSNCPDCTSTTPATPQAASVDTEELELLRSKAAAYDEWSKKTDWVQEQIASFPITSLGRHRADVMRMEIERLRAAQAGGGELTEDAAQGEQEECWSRDEQDFDCLSLGDLLDTHDDLKPGDTVFKAKAVRPTPSRLFSVEWILENLGEAAYDIGGEHAEDYPDVSKAAREELESLVCAWIAKHAEPNFREVVDVQKYELTESDFPGVALVKNGEAS